MRRAAGAAVVVGVVVLAVLGLLRAAAPQGSPSIPEQVQAVAAGLRCPTCQGQSVADSASVLAASARQVIEDQLREGRTPDQVRQYFVDRYGEQVLLSPDASGAGLLAWLLPALAVAAGGVFAWRWLHRARSAPAEPAEDAVGGAARRALAAHRAGALVPDDSPAGESLREALDARLAAAEDDPADAEAVAGADRRLAAAVRRYRARETSARVRAPGAVLPRRVVTAGAAVVLLAAAGVGVGLAVGDRGTGDPVTGDVPGAADPAAGVAALRAEAEARPQDPAAWLALGRALDRARQVDPAVEAYDRALALEPAADDVALLRGNVLVRAGRGAEALPAMRELAGRYPDDPDVLLVLGLAQEAAGAHEAIDTLSRFLELAPNSPAAPGVRALLGDR
ncbi:cytochrome c-type biogenesis protein CcmH [Blastococcus capsensis]|uniref:cytochrome c-type biogenesis protein CcmH n=1 Tax=Blastococcus capsensis TaxID=1564163 RepID=UPI00253FB6AC|nr:cytochrome c-type biogenesis protein CcmH [Blastococcus capsensis]MDK3257575.1 cytochrome c-type biogenesis protein CcmH [Blastococcus capsensis]